MASSSSFTSVFQMKEAIGTHRLKIVDHSLTGGFKPGRYIRSETFTVGEYRWAILYYPNGTYSASDKYISLYVELISEARDVEVFLCFSLADQPNQSASGITSHNARKSAFFTFSTKGDNKGFHNYMGRDSLYIGGACNSFIKDDSFTVECSLQILKPSIEVEKDNSSISVPPSNMHQHLVHLLQSGEGADISFKVKDETFSAHRSILAARSSVFRAELLGSMREGSARCIEIKDMEPQIFKVLLHFIYSDALHLGDDHAEQGVDEDIMIHHLTVAADRYDLQRLRLICEEKLAKKIGADNVVTTLALAEQHNCRHLKEICLDYISSSEVLHICYKNWCICKLCVKLSINLQGASGKS